MSHGGWCPCEPTAACPPLLWGDDAVQHFLKQGRNAENWSSVVFVGVQVVMVTVPVSVRLGRDWRYLNCTTVHHYTPSL